MNTRTQTLLIKVESFVDITDEPYYAVDSALTTTGSVTAGSPILTLTTPQDFADNQWLCIPGGGSPHGIPAPAAPAAVRFGASGTTTYDYKIVGVTSEDGCTAASPQSNQITDGPATLTATDFVRVTITPQPGVSKYLVYGRTNGSSAGWSYRGAAIAHSFKDQRGFVPPCYFDDTTGAFIQPRSPFHNNTAVNTLSANCLRTQIASGGGTTAIVMTDAARTTVSNVIVEHDNLPAFKLAIRKLGAGSQDSSGGRIWIPKGQNYRICGDLSIDRCVHMEGAGGDGDNAATQLAFSDGFGEELQGPRTGPAWCPGKPAELEDRVEPDVQNGYIYECTTAGITGTVYPAWPTTVGATVTDGAAVWTCRASLRDGSWTIMQDFRIKYAQKSIPANRIVHVRHPREQDVPPISAVTRYGGSTGPNISITGTVVPGPLPTIQIEVTDPGDLGAAKCKYSVNGGLSFTSGVVITADLALGTTGLTAHFPPGLYAVGEGYNAHTVKRYRGAAVLLRARARTYRLSGYQGVGSGIVMYGNENTYSNANNCLIHAGRWSSFGGCAVYVEGGDTNHCTVDAGTEAVNCPGGFIDNSFLGCRWYSAYCSGGCTSETFANRAGCKAYWSGCYAEGGQAPSEIRIPGRWSGGYAASGFTTDSDGRIDLNRGYMLNGIRTDTGSIGMRPAVSVPNTDFWPVGSRYLNSFPASGQPDFWYVTAVAADGTITWANGPLIP